MRHSIQCFSTILFLSIAMPAPAQTPSSLLGVWRQDSGESTVRIAQCGASPYLCATVIAERLKPGEPSSLNQTIVQDMRPNGKNGWTGRYIVDGQSMKASAKLSARGMLSFKVCAMAFLCETIRLSRVRS